MKKKRRTRMSISNNMERAIDIYQNSRDGQSAVFNAVKQGTLLVDNWLMCESCEIISPIFNNECLVCSEVIDLTSGEDFTEIDLMV